MYTSHHPQTDGLAKVMNRVVEFFIRCYCALNQKDWDCLLPAAEFAYNSSVSDDLGMAPFEVVLGWKPKSPEDLLSSSESTTESVNEFRRRLAAALEDGIFAQEVAKMRQSAYFERNIQPPNCKVYDLVWLDKFLFKDFVAKAQKSSKRGWKEV